ncbi:hypothetical protein HZS_5577 [Henneguya salminicola]|nr:hypothetical protein HZS_5577 [Henneguya salminicola]
MVYHIGNDIFTRGLIRGKRKYLYCPALHELMVLLEYSYMPWIIKRDFENSPISALKKELYEESLIHKRAYTYIKGLLIENDQVNRCWNYFDKRRLKRYGLTKGLSTFISTSHLNLGAFISKNADKAAKIHDILLKEYLICKKNYY